MTEPGIIAEAELCTSGACYTHHVKVFGTRVAFLSEEQFRRSGAKRFVKDGEVYWEPSAPRSDVVFPKGFALVHDSTSELFDRCHLYVVKLRRGGAKNAPEDVLEDARKFFVDENQNPMRLDSRAVEIPEGPWRRLARVRCIRYKRAGFKIPFEHYYDPPVHVDYSTRVLGWRLVLPAGCFIDAHGFRWP